MSLLVIDLGSSSARTLLFDDGARLIEDSICSRKYDFYSDSAGRATADATELQRLVESCIDEILSHPAARCIRAAGMASFAGNWLGLDADGRACTPVVTYVNTYADVKAESDVCCTSSNAAQVVESLDAEQVIFLPDEYLARNVAASSSKQIVFPSAQPVPQERRAADESNGLRYEIVGWHGRCEVHEQFTVQDIRDVRAQFPDVVVLAHPECSPEVVAASDFSGSTGAMTRYVTETDAPRYLLLTECSMGDNIAAEAHDKEMVRLCSVRCPHMNEITLEEVLASLRENRYQIEVEPRVRARARRAIERMLEIT